MKKFSKKAAIEMSMGAVVVIVLSVTILIFGIIFVKNIMCSGIVLTDQIDQKVSNEIQSLFGTSDFGVKCMGENGIETTLGDGGTREVICMVSTDTIGEYNFNMVDIESLPGSGVSTAEVRGWKVDEDWSGTISPGQKTVGILRLKIPRNVPLTDLKIRVDVSIDRGTPETHYLYIGVKHVGQVASTVC